MFFVEGQTHPDQHLQTTLKLMIEADAWISITLKQHPTEGVEVDIKSANLGAGKSTKFCATRSVLLVDHPLHGTS